MRQWCWWWQWRQLQPQDCCLCGCVYEGSMQLLLLVPLLNFCCCCTDLALHRHHLGDLLGVVTAVLHLALDGGAAARGDRQAPQHACQCHSGPRASPCTAQLRMRGLPCSMQEGAYPKELFRLFSGAVRARSANFSMNASRSRSKKANGICRP